jgi:NAD(P)-dependent dehydrogenase (short-subunit alcohol dehydrogenase family)
MSRLSEKVAIVTGASKGIGAGIATALAGVGARVAVNYSSDREGAERVAKAITDNGGRAIAIGADVSKAAEVARLFKEVDAAFGRLDILVNNAGVFRFGAIAEITEQNFHLHYDINVSRGDSHRAGGDQAVRDRRREHHQPQLYRRLASGAGSPAVRFHERRHRNADQGIGARTGAAQDTRQRHRSRSYRNRRQCSRGDL